MLLHRKTVSLGSQKAIQQAERRPPATPPSEEFLLAVAALESERGRLKEHTERVLQLCCALEEGIRVAAARRNELIVRGDTDVFEAAVALAEYMAVAPEGSLALRVERLIMSIRKLVDEKPSIIKLHPDDLALLQSLGKQEDLMLQGNTWVTDESVNIGDVRIQIGDVDYWTSFKDGFERAKQELGAWLTECSAAEAAIDSRSEG